MAAGTGRGRDVLATGLGWYSIGIAAAQLLAPDAVNRLIGITPTARARATMRAVGVQEATVGVGVLSNLAPATFLWSRVAGDAAHLGLLVAAGRRPRQARDRVAAAVAAVLGVTALDVVAAVRATRAAVPAELHATATVTVRRDPDTVYGYWRDLENLPTFMTHVRSVERTGDARRTHWEVESPTGGTVGWDAEIIQDVPGEMMAWRSVPGADVTNAGVVRFARAPGDRGTEVTVELEFAPPAGAAGAVVAKLLGEHPQQQVRDDLRRFKQVLEVGEVVRTDGSPEGLRTRRLLMQEPAQPHA